MSENYTLTPTGVEWNGDLKLEEWMELGNQLVSIEKGRMFWIGDWVNYGEGKYGERYSQALSHTDYSYSTLRKAAYVCRKVPIAARRPNLTFEQHALVAALDAKSMKTVLDRAEKNGHGIKETREQVHLLTGKAPPAKLEFDEWIKQWEKDNWDEDSADEEALTHMTVKTFRERMAQAWIAGQANK